MSDTRELLVKIAALRQRLDQAVKTAPKPEPSDDADRLARLQHQVASGTAHDALMASSLRELPVVGEGPPPQPPRLTARARRLLEIGHGMLGQLRALSHLLDVDAAETAVAATTDPLVRRFRETLAIADTALRAVPNYPDSPSVQLRLCDGLEGILGVVAERTAALRYAAEQRRRETGWLATLTDLLTALVSGHRPTVAPFAGLAEALLSEAEQAGPLRFLRTEPLPSDKADVPWLARTIACHSLTTGQVIARLARHDPDLRGQTVEVIVAALVHDVGMLRLPLALVAQAGPLSDEQRRVIETHTRLGAEVVAPLLARSAWLSEAALHHHERHDGTGYPDGLRETQVPPLVRLLAVCDVYAALCAPRPHRPAREPRTALTDTLLLADKGALDRTCAERLLHLSFYPVGSVVELADGAVGLVVATHSGRRDLNTPARPVLMLLTTPQGEPLPVPRPLDLAEGEGRSIVRVLPAVERRQLLGRRYPELA
jgi:HD-GYP domain-containing protein (c-di-GMP phosphodiesterase class II)